MQCQEFDVVTCSLDHGAHLLYDADRVDTLSATTGTAVNYFPPESLVSVKRGPVEADEFLATLQDRQLLFLFEVEPLLLKLGIVQVKSDSHVFGHVATISSA